MGSGLKRVYHVEDSPEMHLRIRQELERLGTCEVVGCAGGAAEAIGQIQQIQPDCVVLDLQLAEGTGIDVLRGLLLSGSLPTIVVLTNLSDSTSRKISLRMGATGFFDKSTQFEEFIEAMVHLSDSGPRKTESLA